MKLISLTVVTATAPVALAACASRLPAVTKSTAPSVQTVDVAAQKPSASSRPTSIVAANNSTSTSVPTTTGAGRPSNTGSSGSACTVTAVEDVAKAVATCTSIELSNLNVPDNVMLDLTGLQDYTSIVFSGKTQFGFSPDADFDPITISGSHITVTGAPGSVIDGNGMLYWDGLGSNGGSAKPDHFWVIKDMINATFSDLYVQNWPTHCFYVSGNEYLTIRNLVLNNTAGDAPNDASDGLAAAHNSDGFDLSSSNYVTLTDTTVYNQDDCVAVTSGSNITVTNMYCFGGHGLSIGSIGGKSNNVVDGVTFSDSEVVNSSNGVRIKTNSGTTGSVSNIVYRNIKMSGITDYGLDVQQDYLNGGPTGTPTNGVTVTGLVFENISGSVEDDAYAYYILCGDGSCSDFTFTNVAITGGQQSCNYPTSTCLAA